MAKATRLPVPAPPPPDQVRLDLTMEEAATLKQLLGSFVVGDGKGRGNLHDIWIAMHKIDVQSASHSIRIDNHGRLKYLDGNS